MIGIHTCWQCFDECKCEHAPCVGCDDCYQAPFITGVPAEASHDYPDCDSIDWAAMHWLDDPIEDAA